MVGHLQSVKTHLLPRAGHNQNRHAVVVNGEGVDVLGLLPREILRAAFVILEHVSVSPARWILTYSKVNKELDFAVDDVTYIGSCYSECRNFLY